MAVSFPAVRAGRRRGTASGGPPGACALIVRSRVGGKLRRVSGPLLALPAGRPAWFDLGGPGRPPVRTWAVLPPTLGPASRLVIVVHGTLRNAEEYLRSWVAWACEHDRVVLAPRFDPAGWRGPRRFSQGNVVGPARHGRPRLPESQWSFSVVEDLHRSVRDGLGLADDRFDLWGHSAGAQFVHRFALFKPAAPVRSVIAAGAGWYTLPDPEIDFPYGARHPDLGLGAAALRAWTGQPLVLMRGELDRLRDEHLRVTPQADAQGPHRWARAETMLRAGRRLDPACRWTLVDVPGAAHDERQMAPAAQELLARG